MTSLSGIGSGSYHPYLFQQSLFNEIDPGGSGSITKSKLEQAVSNAGGTTTAADALFSQLDPNNTGSVSEQQFSQNLPGLGFSSQTGAQLIGFQANGWPGASGVGSSGQFAQSLFSQIDTSGSGSITKSDLENAVTKAGGTTAAADALYAKLDPNNTGSVTEQQFASTLSQARPHHGHHHHSGGTDDTGSSPQDALAALFSAPGSNAGSATSPAQLAQDLFSQIDTSGKGSITTSDLETAVTKVGGATTAADALFAQLDPNNTGSVSAQQFAQFLQPPSPTGTTAQDAILALLNPITQSTSGSSASGATGPIGAPSALAVNGTTAQDALLALLSNAGTGGDTNTGTGTSGNSAQDALLALAQAIPGNAATDPNGSSSTGAANGADVASAIARYQNQLNQQIFGAVAAIGATRI
jgi:Ca2+-binding EF-hand superfamily protein